jgi:hypothetical protein
MMDWVGIVMALSLYGFGMFLWGTLSEKDRETERLSNEWADGFRDGWEAAENFDNDVRTIWRTR